MKNQCRERLVGSADPALRDGKMTGIDLQNFDMLDGEDMRIVLTSDDGYDEPGIIELFRQIEPPADDN